jgi:hypothetical protein
MGGHLLVTTLNELEPVKSSRKIKNLKEKLVIPGRAVPTGK